MFDPRLPPWHHQEAEIKNFQTRIADWDIQTLLVAAVWFKVNIPKRLELFAGSLSSMIETALSNKVGDLSLPFPISTNNYLDLVDGAAIRNLAANVGWRANSVLERPPPKTPVLQRVDALTGLIEVLSSTTEELDEVGEREFASKALQSVVNVAGSAQIDRSLALRAAVRMMIHVASGEARWNPVSYLNTESNASYAYLQAGGLDELHTLLPVMLAMPKHVLKREKTRSCGAYANLVELARVAPVDELMEALAYLERLSGLLHGAEAWQNIREEETRATTFEIGPSALSRNAQLISRDVHDTPQWLVGAIDARPCVDSGLMTPTLN